LSIGVVYPHGGGSGQWRRAVIDTPQRCHQNIRYVDETVRLPGYTGTVRQVAVDGLGRAEPTLFLSNNTQETARNLVIRYAGRNRIYCRREDASLHFAGVN